MKKSDNTPAKVKGIYERIPGSGVWWIRYADHRAKIRREKVGRRSDAVTLYSKRKTEILERKKLPEKSLRTKPITFVELSKDALAHSEEENGERSTHELGLKLAIIGEDFNSKTMEEITKQDIQSWLKEQGDKRHWSPATRNRYQAAFSLVFRVGLDNEKITVNPASRIKRKTEDNDRVRFLRNEENEESRLRAEITKPHQLAAFEISIHTGMRLTEQFSLQWRQVDFTNKMVTLSKTKNGKTRHIPLNAVAVAAFERLKADGQGKASPVFPNAAGEPVNGPRGWFEGAVERAGLSDYTWHCNRHTFASRLVMAGVDLPTVKELMGHTTYAMTLRYAHLAPKHKAAAVERLTVQGD